MIKRFPANDEALCACPSLQFFGSEYHNEASSKEQGAAFKEEMITGRYQRVWFYIYTLHFPAGWVSRGLWTNNVFHPFKLIVVKGNCRKS